VSWLARRRLRYKNGSMARLPDIRDRLKTGDIILFHKTARSGFLDSLELDFLAPMFFPSSEFRHCGLIIRRGDELAVLECTQERHTGREHAIYPTGGPAIREVRLEPLLESYTRDNGVPHFGVRHIPSEISPDGLMSVVKAIGPVKYLEGTKSLPLYAASLLLPGAFMRALIARHADQMMCSEFVHSVLAKLGALRDAHSKIFPPYIFESAELFPGHDLAGFSDVVRFTL
jgi:hypothetical protein